MVIATVAHVACGALLLVTAVILAIQISRHVEAQTEPETELETKSQTGLEAVRPPAGAVRA
jgi:hypothetical protein